MFFLLFAAFSGVLCGFYFFLIPAVKYVRFVLLTASTWRAGKLNALLKHQVGIFREKSLSWKIINSIWRIVLSIVAEFAIVSGSGSLVDRYWVECPMCIQSRAPVLFQLGSAMNQGRYTCGITAE